MMNNEFENKIVLVTGGLSGIGLSTAKEYQALGAKVIVTTRSDIKADTFNKEQKSKDNPIHAIQSDTSKKNDVKNLVDFIEKNYGYLHVLCPNAGVGFWNNVSTDEYGNSIDKTTEGEMREQIDVNFIGTIYSIEEFSSLMKKTAKKESSNFSPSIVVVASTAGHKGLANMPVYAATKAAQRSLTRSYAAQLLPFNIKVNCVSPGGVSTEFWGKIHCETLASSENEIITGTEALGAVANHFTSLTPMGRFGEPEEIAKAIVYLSSGNSPYQCGTELIVDGGFTQI